MLRVRDESEAVYKRWIFDITHLHLAIHEAKYMSQFLFFFFFPFISPVSHFFSPAVILTSL